MDVDGEVRFDDGKNLVDVEAESNAKKGSSVQVTVTKKPVVDDLWKPLLPLNYLFPPDYEFYENDAQQLWCLFGDGTPIELLHDRFLQFSCIDNSTGMPMYKLTNMPKDRYEDDYLSMCQYLIIDDVGSCIPKTTMHISVRGSIDSSFFDNLYKIEALKTLLILRGDGPRIDHLPRDLFRKLPYLQALDLSHTGITELPSSIRFSQQLRHLNLSYTSIVELPNSVCNILTLETLNLRGCLNLRSLPKAIRRLTSLKHLDVDVSCLLVSMPPGVGDLCQLQTLPAFVVGKQYGWHINELKNLKYLRQNLRILRLENLSSPEHAKEASLHSKYHLQKLEFHWSRPEDGFEVLESLRPGQHIQELQIVGYGGAKFPSWIGEPSFFRLTAITIHNCSKSNVLPSLGKLRSLKFLHISDMDEVKAIDQQFSGNNIIDHENMVEAFAMLEQLTFIGMPALNQWVGVGEGDFPRLQKLKISHCPKLKILPKLSLFRSLQQLEISLCHSLESFPDGEFPISLQSIVIVECPKLKERCHKDLGENWQKLAHITDIWIDYQKISLVEETPKVRNLGTSKNATGDMVLIHSNFDNHPSPISSLLGDGDDRRQTQEQFEAAEKILLQWDSRTSTPEHHSLLWEESPEEAAEYLSAVDEILQFTEDLTLSHLDEGDITNRAENVLQLAMSRLGDDFRHILIRNTIPLDAGWLHGWIRGVSLPFTSSDWDTDYFGSSVDGDNRSSVSWDHDSGLSLGDDVLVDLIHQDAVVDNSSSVSWYHDSGLSLGDDVFVDLIHQDAVVDLKEIAERMVRLGYERECSQVYSSIRRDVLDEFLSILGIDKLSIEEAQRVEWRYLQEKIKKWIQAVKIVVRRLSGEKYICDQIFQRSELIKEICFTETAKGCVIQLLKFCEAVAIGKRSVEKLFCILDMYEALRDVLPKLVELFSNDSSNFVRSEGNTLLQGLEEAAKDTFAEFENAVQSQTSRKPIQGGEIHPLTRYVMNYVKLIVDYSDTLNLLLQSSTNSPDHVEGNDDDILHSRIDSPLGCRVLLVLSSLESNLEEKSKLYKDGAMQYIFLINNIHYVVQKVKNSDLGKLLGDDWTRERHGQVRQYTTGYLRASWTKALSCLKDEGIGGSGSSSNVSKLTEKLNRFNLCFEEICRTQRQWKVPDPQLREELRITILEIVLPAYRSFLGRFWSHLERGRVAGKYMRYTPESLENHLLDLFEGTSAQRLTA